MITLRNPGLLEIDLTTSILNAKDKHFENRIDFSEACCSPSQSFVTVYNNSPEVKRNPTASTYMRRHTVAAPDTRSTKEKFMTDFTNLCDEYNVVINDADEAGRDMTIGISFTGD